MAANDGRASIGRALIDRAIAQRRHQLGEHEAKQVLSSYGIPVTQEVLLRDRSELRSALKGFSWPVVLKVDSPDILHKTEAGLVALGIRSLAEAEEAFDRLLWRAREHRPEAALSGVLLQEMVTESTECIVGMRRDEQFGPTILFGLGGIFVEVFEDISLRVAPLTARDAEQMVASIKGHAILAGARGRPPANRQAIQDVLLKVSCLALDLGERVVEIDINPLMVGAAGQPAKAADALMILSPVAVPTRPAAGGRAEPA